MDRVIDMTRELGKAIQADERYIRFNTAQQANDEDSALQEMIRTFSEKRELLNAEVQKSEQDSDTIAALNNEVKDLYARIFDNPNMAAYVNSRDEVQELVGFINQIITGSANGLDPDTIQYQQSCGGSCSGCAGCD